MLVTYQCPYCNSQWQGDNDEDSKMNCPKVMNNPIMAKDNKGRERMLCGTNAEVLFWED